MKIPKSNWWRMKRYGGDLTAKEVGELNSRTVKELLVGVDDEVVSRICDMIEDGYNMLSQAYAFGRMMEAFMQDEGIYGRFCDIMTGDTGAGERLKKELENER